MKKNLIYILMSCFIFVFSACSDSIEEATSKHVYGESETPYLRTDANAIVAANMEFSVGHFEPQIIKLTDYADKFQEKMNMTVDQVLKGVKDGTVVFYNINPSKGSWNKVNMTKGSTGWYYNSAGGVCTAEEKTQTASLDINFEAKTLTVNVNSQAKAGVTLNFNVGFAVNGSNYDDYLRFSFNLSVTDPSIITTNISIPDGDFKSFGIDFNQYEKIIQTCMGMSVKGFLDNLDYNGDTGNKTNGSIHMYVVDSQTLQWDGASSYTGEAPGYWLDSKGIVCKYEAKGYSLYANTKNADHTLYIGRAPKLAAGSVYNISIGYKDTKNEKNFFCFIITVTLK